MATEPKTYRVSAEVDGEISRLAKIHGGVDKALRKMLLGPAESGIAGNSTSDEGQNQATRRAQAEAALQMQEAQGRVQPEVPETQAGATNLPKNAFCKHCGKRFAGSKFATICAGCVVGGHRGMPADCGECSDRGTGGL